MYRLGIDLGGTKIEGVVLQPDGRVSFRERVPTEQENGYEHILGNIKTVYDQMVGSISGAQHRLGIGTPGAISPKSGLLKNSNTLCLNGKPVHTDLSKLIGHELIMENDANCFALAEAVQGAAKGCDVVFGVILGTGCGGGLVINGQVRTGVQAISGEWGHMKIDPEGPECYCGHKGCTETFISGSGLQKNYTARFGEVKAAKDIIADYRDGEERASAAIDDFFDRFGLALSNLLNIIDPDAVVLGGGLSNFDELYTVGVERVGKFIFSDSMETPVLKNKLGDSAGVIGAAYLGG